MLSKVRVNQGRLKMRDWKITGHTERLEKRQTGR